MNHEERLNNIISRLVGNSDPEDIKAAYRDWAKNYDQDLDFFGYVAPRIGVEYFHQALEKPAGLILDAGCGTGLCGQMLTKQGYSRIHGADFSAEMLVQARQSGYYQQLTEANFRHPLIFDDNTYDGVLSIGVYSSFLGPDFVAELVRITKPNGVVCISCRFNFYDSDLLPNLQQLETANRITIESAETQPYMTGQDADAVYIVMGVL